MIVFSILILLNVPDNGTSLPYYKHSVNKKQYRVVGQFGSPSPDLTIWWLVVKYAHASYLGYYPSIGSCRDRWL